MWKILGLLIAYLLGNNANAVLITENGYTLDTETDIVTGGGLEWLQWNETYELSPERALGNDPAYAIPGNWRLATGGEMAALYNAWGFGGITWLDDSTIDQSASLFGSTPESELESLGVFHQIFTDQDSSASSRALYGAPNGAGLYGFALLTSFFNPDGSLATGNARLSPSVLTGPGRFDGLALVRHAGAIAVPEPSSIFILSLGLIGVALKRPRRGHRCT